MGGLIPGLVDCPFIGYCLYTIAIAGGGGISLPEWDALQIFLHGQIK